MALFALALQITLSFGHFHQRDFAGIPGVAVAQGQDGSDRPAGHNDADGYCLVCATVSLAGTLVLPDQVALQLPVISADIQHSAIARGVLESHRLRAVSRARASPRLTNYLS